MVFLGEILAPSSFSSSSSDHKKYDVFLSFRGVDTRLSFTNHLHNALEDANLTTFLDNEEIQTGLYLTHELESAIKASRASIIVLSQNYASSTWCLNELVLILEQHRTSNHIVIPILYHVEQNSFGDAMTKHRLRMEAETNIVVKSQLVQKLEIWKKALAQISYLKVMDAKGRLETKFIEEIVKEIYHRLGVPLRITLPQLIGMDDSIKIMTSWLKDGSSQIADIFTILGMGGIGKTSFAKYVYELHCLEYSGCFIKDVSRRCAQLNGLLDVQKQLCDEISKTSLIPVHDDSVYTSMIESALARKKVLLVLDDIDSLDQLDALLGKKGFHPGSKIIITTKDASLTERCALFKSIVKPKHTKMLLKGLSKDASLQLLCLHAFSSNNPKEGYKEVSKMLAKFCEGHPLALEVVGKSLHNRDVDEWGDYIERLKKEADSHIKKVLKMSFDSLPSKNDKELFKHIACFFVGIDRDFTETVLKACNINTRSGIKILIDRCLLSIGRHNKLKMHQLLQEMGRDLVRQESPDKPWKRSRLWCHEESFKVIKQRKGKGSLLGLTLDMRMLDKDKVHGSYELKTNALSKMDNLMILHLNYVQINGSYENFPQELRWLCMHGFRLKSIPLDLPMDNVVVLDMSYSKIESFGMCYSEPQPLENGQNRLTGSSSKDRRLFRSLKILDLSFCEQLHRLCGFLELPALERLIVRNCTSLIEVCESLEKCVELLLIDLSCCNKLEKLPRAISKLKKVKTLLLDGCKSSESRMKKRDRGSLEIFEDKNMDINSHASSSTLLETIPSNLNFYVISFPSSLVRLSLAHNNLSNESFPMDISCLSMLKELYLDENPIITLPNCVRSLPRLEILSMRGCKMLTSIEHPPYTLKKLILFLYKSLLNDYKLMIQRIAFDPGMPPLKLSRDHFLLVPSSFEIEGMAKIQPMVDVDEKVLSALGWLNLESIQNQQVKTQQVMRGTQESVVQMYFEFGIFSTIYGTKGMPNWIRHRSKGPSISTIIPSSSQRLRGLNFCYVQTLLYPNGTFGFPYDEYFELPMIIISNITKNRNWIYHHCIDKVNVGSLCLTLISHWMFGMNEMEGGDLVTITVTRQRRQHCDQLTKMCGISLVYDSGNIEEEDPLGCYKSWNHIIRRDLSSLHSTTESILYTEKLMRYTSDIDTYYGPIITDSTSFKDEVCFKAFSRRKSNIFGYALEDAMK